MFADILSAHYDSYNPEFSLTLVNSLESYINLKLEHERKTSDFIKELRQRLYLIHEYNCQVAKVTHRYPRTTKLDLLLIKYVELEFEVLHSSSCVSGQLEEMTELKVLRLLQVILYPAVLSNQPLIDRNTVRTLREAVLQLVGKVRATYFTNNHLVYNIAQKLIKRIGGNFRKTAVANSSRSALDCHGNLTTSDYGSDDSDYDLETNLTQSRGSQFSRKGDCVEVPLTTNGQAHVPTVEFTEDDNYLIYLQKPASVKRKKKDFNSNYRKKVSIDKKTRFKKERSEEAAAEDSRVVICSDSDDETQAVDKKPLTKNCKQQNEKKNVGVVTFEILDDDDDDDDGQTNYMVYLQKEVETNRRKRKDIDCASEIVVCSDSDDETTTHTVTYPKTQLQELQEQSSSNNSTVPLIQADSTSDNIYVSKNRNESCTQNICSGLNEINRQSDENVAINIKDVKTENEQPIHSMPSNQQIDVQMSSTSTDVNMYALTFLNQQTNKIIEDQVEPSTIHLQAASASHAEFDETDSPGGPIMSEKVDDFEELANLSDHRLNENILEELLQDDTYLLEGCKGFRDLEYFLFNDSSQNTGFFLSNNSFVDAETVAQPETFDADIKRLEFFIADSQLINCTDSGNISSSSFNLHEKNSANSEEHSNDKKINNNWEEINNNWEGDKRDILCVTKTDGRRISRR